MENHEKFMSMALDLARQAALEGEVPVGAVVVKDSVVVGSGMNRRETGKNALLHAEIEAINQACLNLGGWRLFNCDLYVTLEPCPMCAGAIINSRIKTVVFGADDYKNGAVGSVVNLFELPFNHRPELVKGVLKDECSAILSEFFKNLRLIRKNGDSC